MKRENMVISLLGLYDRVLSHNSIFHTSFLLYSHDFFIPVSWIVRDSISIKNTC